MENEPAVNGNRGFSRGREMLDNRISDYIIYTFKIFKFIIENEKP